MGIHKEPGLALGGGPARRKSQGSPNGPQGGRSGTSKWWALEVVGPRSRGQRRVPLVFEYQWLVGLGLGLVGSRGADAHLLAHLFGDLDH